MEKTRVSRLIRERDYQGLQTQELKSPQDALLQREHEAINTIIVQCLEDCLSRKERAMYRGMRRGRTLQEIGRGLGYASGNQVSAFKNMLQRVLKLLSEEGDWGGDGPPSGDGAELTERGQKLYREVRQNVRAKLRRRREKLRNELGDVMLEGNELDRAVSSVFLSLADELDGLSEKDFIIPSLVSPYNFAPLLTDRGWPHWVDCTSHDRSFKDGVGESPAIRLTAQTPLFMGSGALIDGVETFYQDDAGRCAIPGSSLRGMLRSVVDRATFGRLAPTLQSGSIRGRFMCSPIELVTLLQAQGSGLLLESLTDVPGESGCSLFVAVCPALANLRPLRRAMCTTGEQSTFDFVSYLVTYGGVLLKPSLDSYDVPSIFDRSSYQMFVLDEERWSQEREQEYGPSPRWLRHDYRSFVARYIERQKIAQRDLARVLGVSAGFVSTFLRPRQQGGRFRQTNIFGDHLELLLDFLQLPTVECEQLRNLMWLEAARRGGSEHGYLFEERVRRAWRQEQFDLGLDEVRSLFGDFRTLVLREMVALRDFVPDPDWIRGRMSCTSPELDIDALFQGLLTSGQVEEKSGQWFRHEPPLNVASDFRHSFFGPILRDWFEAALEQSRRSLVEGGEGSFLRARTVCVSSAELERLRSLSSNLLGSVRSVEGNGDYVVNIIVGANVVAASTPEILN
jgi:transcriptional regulator with XRE-family HTH domain